jgi:ABC-type dipeptide/oligopeptide/nickel transport system permease component
LLIVVANLLADVVSQLIDPRARLNDRPVTGWSR